jgi:UDPglucose 6-dehydrogenase
MADICAATGGDVAALADSLGMDPRIGIAFLRAGVGYGGACLPKDVRGLGTFARALGVRNAVTLLTAVDEINVARANQAVGLVEAAVDGVAGKHVAAWGATFKAGTDDVRDSAALLVADRLRSLGATVRVCDPMGIGNALMSHPDLDYTDSAVAAATGADVVVVLTAWPEFAQADPAEIAGVARGAVVVDACQGISPAAWHSAGWSVSSLIGSAVGH